MKLTVTIDMKHQAFADTQGEELAKTLKKVAAKIAGLKNEYLEDFSFNLHDTNGVPVGVAKVEP
jgi:hypothetical protein